MEIMYKNKKLKLKTGRHPPYHYYYHKLISIIYKKGKENLIIKLYKIVCFHNIFLKIHFFCKKFKIDNDNNKKN